MSAWDELKREQVGDEAGAESSDRVPDGSPWAEEGADPGGVTDVGVVAGDEHIVDLESEPQDEPPPKKNLKPLLYAAAAFAVALIVGMGFMVKAMLGAGKPAQTPSAIEAAAPAPDKVMDTVMAGGQVDQPVGMFEADPAHAASAASDASVQSVDAAVVPASAPAAVVAAAPAAAAALPPSSQPKTDSELASQVATLTGRLDGLQGDVEEIKRQIAALNERRAALSRSATAAKPAVKVAGAGATKKTAKAKTAEIKGGPDAGKGDGAPGAQPQAGGLSGLALRAVNPPTGPDMQAWVMDGDKVVVVSKGSTIRGAKVTLVESDRVVTDRGVIR